MEIINLKNYKCPNYPLKDEVVHNPALIKNLPERWKVKAITSVAISTSFLFLHSSCKPSPTNLVKTAGMAPFKISTLTEDEAFIIINDEFKKLGINFDKECTQLKNIDLPYEFSGYINALKLKNRFNIRWIR